MRTGKAIITYFSMEVQLQVSECKETHMDFFCDSRFLLYFPILGSDGRFLVITLLLLISPSIAFFHHVLPELQQICDISHPNFVACYILFFTSLLNLILCAIVEPGIIPREPFKNASSASQQEAAKRPVYKYRGTHQNTLTNKQICN